MDMSLQRAVQADPRNGTYALVTEERNVCLVLMW